MTQPTPTDKELWDAYFSGATRVNAFEHSAAEVTDGLRSVWFAALASRADVDGELEEAKVILRAMSHEYNKDEMCDGVKINKLIERGEVFLSDGAFTSKAYWACWGGEGTPTPEDSEEYKRYCERCAKRWDNEHSRDNSTRSD